MKKDWSRLIRCLYSVGILKCNTVYTVHRQTNLGYIYEHGSTIFRYKKVNKLQEEVKVTFPHVDFNKTFGAFRF